MYSCRRPNRFPIRVLGLGYLSVHSVQCTISYIKNCGLVRILFLLCILCTRFPPNLRNTKMYFCRGLPIIQKSTTPNLHSYNSVKVHPYAHSWHIKVHFIYVWYGCYQVTLYICMIWMWGAVHGALEPQPWHYKITRARTNPKFSKIHPVLQSHNSVRVHPYAHPHHMKVSKEFIYIRYGCGMQSRGIWSLNYDMATSLGLRPTPISLKSTPDLHRRNSVRVHTHMSTHSISRCQKTVYTYDMDVGCSPRGFGASTMTLQHHSGSDLQQFS